MSILLTGFGPFPGVQRNPSQLLVERFADRQKGQKIHRVVIPTVYADASTVIEDRLVELRPWACLCLGVAGPGPLRLEILARNHDKGREPDQSGAVRHGPIQPTGPDTYPSTLPLTSIHGALRGQGVAVAYSDDAGGYLCNHLFYAVRHAIDRHGLAIPCGFIHVPSVDPVDREDEAIDRMVRAIEVVVEVLLQEVEAPNDQSG